ncbi:hypothetical protein MNBD_GAMMA12-2264 [hydrothermal vent metagenome]|uniref:Uncharacterized protein n=1 Tax=hydrothermal vent metagenome TaxID=652676 RepID=A0A3B0YLZ7_9ZZZZ
MNAENLINYEGKLNKVRLERKYPSEIYTNGFVHFVNNEIVILQQYHDFYCEEYCVLRMNDIMEIRSNKCGSFGEFSPTSTSTPTGN